MSDDDRHDKEERVPQARLRFRIELGLLNYHIIRQLKYQAVSAGLVFDSEHNGGWIDRKYMCMVMGDKPKVLEFKQMLEGIQEKLEERDAS